MRVLPSMAGPHRKGESEMIGFSVVGAGAMGRLHARAIARRASQVGDCELRFVFDRHAARSEAVAKEFGGRSVSSLQAVLEAEASVHERSESSGAQAAVVAVPTLSHAEVATSLLDHDFDVLLEKPMTGDLVAANALVEKARSRERILSVGHVEWWNVGLHEALSSVGTPRRIEMVRYNPPSDRGLDIDVIQDFMLHDLDWVRRRIPSVITSISASGRARRNPGLDEAEVDLVFNCGARATLRASRVHAERRRFLVIDDDETTVRADLLTGRIDRIRQTETLAEGGAGELPESIRVSSTEEPLDAQLADFVDAITHRREPVNSGAVGLETLVLVERVREIIGTGSNPNAASLRHD